MDKIRIARIISDKTGIPAYVCQCIIEQFGLSVMESISKGENVYLRGFGTFLTRKVKGRERRDFGTGEMKWIDSYTAPHFKPCKEFKSKMK